MTNTKKIILEISKDERGIKGDIEDSSTIYTKTIFRQKEDLIEVFKNKIDRIWNTMNEDESEFYYIGLVDEDYNNWRTVGVFSSEKLAQEAINKYKLENKYALEKDMDMIVKCKLNEYLKHGGWTPVNEQ